MRDERGVELDGIPQLRRRKVEVSGNDCGVEWMEPILERGSDPEVSATAAYRPEQIRLIVLAEAPYLAVRGHELDVEQIVAGQTEAPCQPAEATAEREPRDSGVGDLPERGRQGVHLRLS